MEISGTKNIGVIEPNNLTATLSVKRPSVPLFIALTISERMYLSVGPKIFNNGSSSPVRVNFKKLDQLKGKSIF